MKEIKQVLKKKLTKGLDTGFKAIEENIDPSSLFYNELVLLQARHQRIVEECRLGIMDRIEMDKLINTITYSTIQVIDKLDEDDFYSLRDTSNKIDQFSVPGEFRDSNIGIIRFDNSYPYYKSKNIKIELNEDELFFGWPIDVKNKIKELGMPIVFNKEKNTIGKAFTVLEDLIGENEFDDLLNQHKNDVANMFLQFIQEGRTIFNGKLFGISFAIFNRKGIDEVSIAHLKLYESDYFTYKVFRSLYTDIKTKYDVFGRLNSQNIKPYLVLSNSLGLNLFITVKDKLGEDRLVFTKRSKFVANEEFSSIWHVSVNETISQTDVEDSEVNFFKSVRRGIKEELGIDEGSYNLNTLKIYSFFLVESVFEVGVSAFLRTNISYSNFLLSQENAKDSVLETEDVTGVLFNRKSIINFMKNHELTPAAIHVLKLIIDREL